MNPRRALVAGLAVVPLVLAGPASLAHADSGVPYSDPDAVGVIGLCSPAGQPISSGGVHDAPFVGRAVASVSAPSEEQGNGEKATLYAYIPAMGVNPAEWSGQILTGSTFYPDPKHPTAVGTSADLGLDSVTSNIPPRWDGYVELRLIYSAPNQPTSTTGYAATDIQVTGDTWHVVRGGTEPCNDGQPVSDEAEVPGLLTSASPDIPTYINGRPNPRAFPHGIPTTSLAPFHDPDDASATPGPTATSTTGATGATSPAAVTPSPGDTVTSASPGAVSNAADAGERVSSGGHTGLILGVLIGVVVGGFAVVFAGRFRRRPHMNSE